VRQWCGYWGQAEALTCIDGDCAPYLSQMPGCQQLPPAPQQPAIVPTAVATTPPPQPPITPPDLNQRLPVIVSPAPVEVGPPPCDGVGVWVARNQGIVLMGLVGLALMCWKE